MKKELVASDTSISIDVSTFFTPFSQNPKKNNETKNSMIIHLPPAKTILKKRKKNNK